MPKQIPTESFEELINAIANREQGASLQELMDSMQSLTSRRTLQRHLSILEDDGRLERQGKGPATRYFVKTIAMRVKKESEREAPRKGLSLSGEAVEIRERVSADIADRTPVGYNRDFLDHYVPNDTQYLPTETRRELHDFGDISRDGLPAGTFVREIYARLLIDLSWNSSRLEGNTYSILETERLLELGEAADGKDAREAQMILNHKGAIELISDVGQGVGLNRYTICNLHAILSENLLSDSRACGQLRTKPVGITGTVFRPLAVPQMIDECFDLILEKVRQVEDPFEQAFFVMVHLPYLQPFEDVNKRLSRLAANIPVLRQDLCPLSFVGVPIEEYTKSMLGVYELNAIDYLRDVFVSAYKRSCQEYSAVRQSLGEPDPVRFLYRELLKRMIHDVVRDRMAKTQAVELLRNMAESAPENDQKRLLEIAETELSSLHEGNILRYDLRPAEYEEWRKIWQ
jgi:Fic family protein